MTLPDTLKKLCPGIRWLKDYTPQTAISDLIAGITVGLTVLPQGLAYATLAGLEPQYGLYSAFVGGIVYAFLGSCREVTIGPTALLALMTSRHTSLGLQSGPTYAILLCFLSGIVELIMAFLRLGALVDLISLPVTVGFTSATAVIIGTSQLKGMMGLSGGSSSGFIGTVRAVIYNINETRIGDLSLGVTAIIILLLLRRLKSTKISETVRGYKWINTTIWLIATSRNALIVFGTSILAFYKCQDIRMCPFKLTGTVKSGLPSFNLPQFYTTVSGGDNSTAINQDFMEMFEELGPSILIVPIIAVLGNVAISKAFKGSGINPTRELIALSFSNIFGSFFSSIPVTGSFSRSAVNHASGVKTPIGGIFTSILVLVSLKLLTPYFKYIPKASLSAVIISAVIFMIEYEVLKPLWRCSRREILPGAITFIVSLTLGVEIGLLLGVSTDLGFLVYRAARPALSVTRCETDEGIPYILIRPKHSLLYFPAIEWVRNGISKAVDTFGLYPVILDCSHLTEFDFTAARGMGALQKELSIMEVHFFLLKASAEVKTVLNEATENTLKTLESIAELKSYLDGSGTGDENNQVILPLISQTGHTSMNKEDDS